MLPANTAHIHTQSSSLLSFVLDSFSSPTVTLRRVHSAAQCLLAFYYIFCGRDCVVCERVCASDRFFSPDACSFIAQFIFILCSHDIPTYFCRRVENLCLVVESHANSKHKTFIDQIYLAQGTRPVISPKCIENRFIPFDELFRRNNRPIFPSEPVTIAENANSEFVVVKNQEKNNQGCDFHLL